MKVSSLYICPWSLNDPLCQSQSLAYLFGLAKHGHKFALMTFENPKYVLTRNDQATIKKELVTSGIYWYPVKYHQGLSLSAKAYDNAAGFILGLKILYKHRPLIIHSRSSLTALLAYTLSKIGGLKFLYDADSILSEEYVATGHWSQQSRGFKILAAAENMSRKNSDRIIVLTEVLKQDFECDYKIKKPIDVIPCCVDTEQFRTDPETRSEYRNRLKIKSSERLLVYVGKIGDRYLVDKIFEFFGVLRRRTKNLRMLIVSRDPVADFDSIAAEKNIDKKSYFVCAASPVEVCNYLAAADAGVAFIKNSVSERGASPIKISEYLAAGLPVVMNDEIGDLSHLVERNQVGFILKNFSLESYERAAEGLSRIWENKGENAIAKRCRETAENQLSLKIVGVPRYAEIYERILSEKTR